MYRFTLFKNQFARYRLRRLLIFYKKEFSHEATKARREMLRIFQLCALAPLWRLYLTQRSCGKLINKNSFLVTQDSKYRHYIKSKM